MRTEATAYDFEEILPIIYSCIFHASVCLEGAIGRYAGCVQS